MGSVRSGVATSHESKGRGLTRHGGSHDVDTRFAPRNNDFILALQELAGNRAVSRLLSTSTFVAGEDHPYETEAKAAEFGFGHRGGAQPVPSRNPSPLASGHGAPVPSRAARTAGLSPAAASRVRLHTGSESDAMNEALGSEGFTHGSDVFLSSDSYRPGTQGGDALLAHELSHAAGPAAATGGLFLKRKKMHLDFLRFKRKETHIGRMLAAMALSKVGADKAAEWVDTDKSGRDIDHYGHWWVEAGSLSEDGSWAPAESYGWWPATSVGIAQTLKIKRVEGLLNQGNPDDPHQGDTADTEFHPVMEVDDQEPYEAVRDRVMGEVRNFAHGFHGSWNWRLAWGKNCHTFQDRMKKALGLHHQKAKDWLRGSGVAVQKPAAKGYDEIRAALDSMGLLGGGFGMLNMAQTHFKDRFTPEEISGLSQAERRQLANEINANQDGWNRARAADLNDFFSNATGDPRTYFSEEDVEGATTTATETTTGTTGATSATAPNQTGSGGPTSVTSEVTGQVGASTATTETTERQLPDTEVTRLQGLQGEIVTLDKPVQVGDVTLAKDETLYVVRISSENKVYVNRSTASGGGYLWIDGAAFLSAIAESSLNTETTTTEPQTQGVG